MKQPIYNLHPRRCRAFFAMEAAWSIGLALLLLFLISSVIVRQRAAETRLAAIRTASRATESALLELQAGKALPADFQLEKLSDKAPAGYAWVRVTAQPTSRDLTLGVHPERASLVGLVPASATAGGVR